MTPFEVLGVPSDASPEEIKRAYRRLAQVHHPDKGGDAATFTHLTAAYEAALKPKKCPACFGKGHVRERQGAITKKIPCPRCWS